MVNQSIRINRRSGEDYKEDVQKNNKDVEAVGCGRPPPSKTQGRIGFKVK
jgi:hypothetical protein